MPGRDGIGCRLPRDNPEMTTSSDSDVLAPLADDFLARHRRGEQPSPHEYAARHPELAGQIRELFAALLVVEGLGGSLGGQASAGDTADLYDSKGNDTLTAAGSTATLIGPGYSLGVSKFHKVTAHASTGVNKKKVQAIDFVFEALGRWS